MLSNVSVNHVGFFCFGLFFGVFLISADRRFWFLMHLTYEFSENVNGFTSGVSKQFLNELSGTVAVITSDGRMIVVRLVFFNFLFPP